MVHAHWLAIQLARDVIDALAIARANRFTRFSSDPNPVLASNDVKYELADASI